MGNVIMPLDHQTGVGGYEFENIGFTDNISANPTEAPLEIDAQQAENGTYYR